ncbi:MAG: TatD family nuclease-associated radical SAM protein [Candidatus Gastranaerophilales bacterium]|nr:TatD family nuclease-associated radical SAM protein [Candidatus Gastranaerophilales bacterium]
MANYNLVYILDGKVYINLTNSCTNNCVFCIRSLKNDVAGADLFLNTENVKSEDVISQLEAIKDKLHNLVSPAFFDDSSSPKNWGSPAWLRALNGITVENSTFPPSSLCAQSAFQGATQKFRDKELERNFLGRSKEIVFCGYGEPMLKLDIIKQTAKYIKDTYPETIIRINTNGHANLIYKRNVLPELKGLIDKFSISLNGENETVYNELSQPNIEGAYTAVKEFIREAVKEGFDTTATVVTGYKNYKVDVPECIKITKELGAKFRERPWLDNGY